MMTEAKTECLCDSWGRVAVPKRMNFRKSLKGGGVIFNTKNYISDFVPLYRALMRAFHTGLYRGLSEKKSAM